MQKFSFFKKNLQKKIFLFRLAGGGHGGPKLFLAGAHCDGAAGADLLPGLQGADRDPGGGLHVQRPPGFPGGPLFLGDTWDDHDAGRTVPQTPPRTLEVRENILMNMWQVKQKKA